MSFRVSGLSRALIASGVAFPAPPSANHHEPTLYTVMGASLLSAAASLPLTLLPLLVLAVLQEGRLPAAHAGWVGSAYMLGQLIAVLVLPTLHVRRIARSAACAAVLVLVAATFLSSRGSGAVLLGSWLLVGVVCGCMQFLASTAAASATDPTRAFAVRMAVSSTLGGMVVAALQVAKAFVDYATLSAQVALAFAAVAGAGLALYRTPPLVTMPARTAATSALSVSALAGFFVLFIVFVGQHGLWAFALKGAQQRGLLVDNVMWAIALCKFAGAAVVMTSIGRNAPGAPSMFLPSVAVAAGGASVALAGQAAVLFLGLLCWEVGMNVLSARLQAALARQNAQRAGMWMSSAIFLGAATGPALAGWATSAGVFGSFAVFAVGTALVPCIWAVALLRVRAPLPLKPEA
jgi:hypothetical protein